MPSADNLCRQFGPIQNDRPDLDTICYVTLIEFFEKKKKLKKSDDDKKSIHNYPVGKELSLRLFIMYFG